MNRLRSVLALLFSLAVTVGVGYGLFYVLRASWRVLRALESDLAVAVVAAAASVFVSVLSIVVARVFETRAKIQEQNREKKIPVYEALIEFMMRVLLAAKTGKPVEEAEVIEFMHSFTQRIMVWGSDDVLAAWVRFRKQTISIDASKAEPLQAMFVFEDIVKAMRRDLGHKNAGIAQGDVLALFVNDIQDHLPKRRRSAS